MLDEKTVNILRRALIHSFHEYSCDGIDGCKCWKGDMQRLIDDKPQVQGFVDPDSLVVCKYCGHKQTMHMARFKDGTKGCCRVDCTCLEFKLATNENAS